MLTAAVGRRAIPIVVLQYEQLSWDFHVEATSPENRYLLVHKILAVVRFGGYTAVVWLLRGAIRGDCRSWDRTEISWTKCKPYEIFGARQLAAGWVGFQQTLSRCEPHDNLSNKYGYHTFLYIPISPLLVQFSTLLLQLLLLCDTYGGHIFQS